MNGINLYDILGRLVYILGMQTICTTLLMWFESRWFHFPYEKVKVGLNWADHGAVICNYLALTGAVMVVVRGLLPSEFDESLMVCPLLGGS
jgi:hypothetical protein